MTAGENRNSAGIYDIFESGVPLRLRGVFFERCQDVGIDGIIIPDLPFEEKEEVDVVASRYGIDLISMIAPTSKERIRKIAKGAKGFLYVVSSMGVTGERTNITTDIGGMLKEIRSVSSVPAAVGFGIHTPDQAAEISKTAEGWCYRRKCSCKADRKIRLSCGRTFIHLCADDEGDGQPQRISGSIHAAVSENMGRGKKSFSIRKKNAGKRRTRREKK